MRPSLLVALLAAPALAATPPRKAVVAVLPPVATPALAPLGLLVELQAAELLEDADAVRELHPLQVRPVVELERLDPASVVDAKSAARPRAALGADRLATVKIEASASGLQLSGLVVEGTWATPWSSPPAATWSEAVAKAGRALATALGLPATPARPARPVQPWSPRDGALQALGACAQTLLEQPLGVENPTLLDAAQLDGAIAQCRQATELDPTLRFATALLAYGQALAGEGAAATRTLATLGEGQDALEASTLARFWLLTRYQSNEAGVAFLQDVIAHHPAELLPRAVLAETWEVLNEQTRAARAWTEYLALCPASPTALAHLGRAQARLGQHPAAVASSRAALELDREGREARLQLASRQIDAGRPADALATLEPLLQAGARGEAWLRAGWARWLLHDVEGAAQAWQQALDRATAPGEWRTRGRAFYNLALADAKRGHPDAARVSLKASLQTGFRVRTLDPLLIAVAGELDRGGVAARATPDAGALRPSLVPRESSLFPLDAFGDVDPAARRPPPPEGLVLYRF